MARPRTSPQPEVPGLAARRIAADILDGVLRRKIALDEQLSGKSAHPGLATLPDRDRALMRRLTATVLRRLGTLRHLLGGFLDKGFPAEAPRVETILLIGAAQILWLEVPDHAAVDLSVRLAQADRRAARYAGLINAVLRRVTQSRDTAQPANATRDTPKWLVARWTKRYGAETARAIAQANGHEPALDLTVKYDAESWAERLRGRVLPTGSVRTLAQGAISLLPGFTEGAWWVQDAAASLPARLLRRRGRQGDRRSVRGARRQDRATRLRRRARHRGRSLGGAAQPSARKSDAAFAAKPTPSPPMRWNGRAVRSTPCCSTRRAPRPAPSAAIPTCPGSRAKPTSPRWPRCSSACSTAPSICSSPAQCWSIASARWSRRKPRTRSPPCLARDPRVSRAPVAAQEVAGHGEFLTATATCARCRRNCPTPIRAGAGSTAFTPPGSPQNGLIGAPARHIGPLATLRYLMDCARESGRAAGDERLHDADFGRRATKALALYRAPRVPQPARRASARIRCCAGVSARPRPTGW